MREREINVSVQWIELTTPQINFWRNTSGELNLENRFYCACLVFHTLCCSAPDGIDHISLHSNIPYDLRWPAIDRFKRIIINKSVFRAPTLERSLASVSHRHTHTHTQWPICIVSGTQPSQNWMVCAYVSRKHFMYFINRGVRVHEARVFDINFSAITVVHASWYELISVSFLFRVGPTYCCWFISFWPVHTTYSSRECIRVPDESEASERWKSTLWWVRRTFI